MIEKIYRINNKININKLINDIADTTLHDCITNKIDEIKNTINKKIGKYTITKDEEHKYFTDDTHLGIDYDDDDNNINLKLIEDTQFFKHMNYLKHKEFEYLTTRNNTTFFDIKQYIEKYNNRLSIVQSNVACRVNTYKLDTKCATALIESLKPQFYDVLAL